MRDEPCGKTGCTLQVGHEDPCTPPSPVLLAKVEAIEACIRTVESQILTANACRYSEAYVLGMQNILIFHRATLERVKRGEGYHPSTPVCG